MFELYLPYLIAVAMGMSVPGDMPGTGVTIAATETVQAVEASKPGEETAQDFGRAPEPQIATGQFTTALEVKPILGMTKLQWSAISFDGTNDLLYFSNLLAWRCGLWEIRYGVNGAPADTVLPMEPCHLNTASPNAMTDITGFPIWVTLPGNSIQTLRIEVTFDDGTEDFVEVQRTQIILP